MLIIWPPVTHIGFLLADNSRLARWSFDQQVRALGVTGPQARLLLTLHRAPGENQGFYAERLEVEPITLCRMVDRLAEAGLVERRADPRDRRVWRLHLLPPALPIVDRLAEIGQEVEREALVHLDDEERDQLVDSLRRLREALREDGRKQVA